MKWESLRASSIAYIAGRTLPKRILVRVLADVVEWSLQEFRDTYAGFLASGEELNALDISTAACRDIRKWCRGEETRNLPLHEEKLMRHRGGVSEQSVGFLMATLSLFPIISSSSGQIRVTWGWGSGQGLLADNAESVVLNAVHTDRPGYSPRAAERSEQAVKKLLLERLPTRPFDEAQARTEGEELHWPYGGPLITVGGGYALVNDQIFDLATGTLYYEHGQDTDQTRVMVDWLKEQGFAGLAGFHRFS